MRQLDHIFASVADPRGPFNALAELGFPVAWPVTETRAITSGGFFLSNLEIEFAFFEGDVFHAESAPLRFTGLAFEPLPLARALPLLNQRGIQHRPPVDLGSFSNCFITHRFPSFYVFLCERRYKTHPWNDPVEDRRLKTMRPVANAAGRWEYYRGLIESGTKGPLGLVSAKQLLVGAPDISDASARWEPVLGQSTKDEPTWLLPPGPSIRLVEHPVETVLGLEISVESLDAAKEFLSTKGCLGEVAPSEVRIDPEAVWGVDLRLVPV